MKLFKPIIKNGLKYYLLFGLNFKLNGKSIDKEYFENPIFCFFFWTFDYVDSFIRIPFLKFKKNLDYTYGFYFIKLPKSNALQFEYSRYDNDIKTKYKGIAFGLDNNLKHIAIKPIIKNNKNTFYFGWIVFNLIILKEGFYK